MIVCSEKHLTYSEILNHLMMARVDLPEGVDVTLFSKKMSKYASLFVAEENDNIVGLVACYINDDEAKKAYITHVDVLPQYRGHGIASHLLELCINSVKGHDFSSIRLEVLKDNYNAQRLYRKFLFFEVEDRYNRILMEKILV